MWKLSNEVLLDNLDNWNQHGRTAMPWYEHKKLIHFYVIFASIKAFYAILFIFKSFYWWFLLIFKVILLIIFTIFLDHQTLGLVDELVKEEIGANHHSRSVICPALTPLKEVT